MLSFLPPCGIKSETRNPASVDFCLNVIYTERVKF